MYIVYSIYIYRERERYYNIYIYIYVYIYIYIYISYHIILVRAPSRGARSLREASKRDPKP